MPLTQSSDELAAWLRLSLEPHIGSATACMLLSALGLPDQIYAQRATALSRHVPEALARQLAAPMPADMAEQGEQIPEPLSERRYSGKFNLRVGESLHRELAIHAAEEGMSLNQYLLRKLSAA